MANKKSLKALKIATAGLALTAAASPVYAQVLPTSQVAYAAVTVNSGDELVRALRNATAGEIITLGQGFTLTPAQIGGGSTFTIPAGVTIDGATNTLTVRGIDIKTADDVTLKNLNYTIVKDGATEGSITATSGKLTLENVTTLINAAQADTRPLLVADGGNVVVTGGDDQTVFDKIVAKQAGTITLATSNVRSTNGVELVNGSTVTTSSNFVSKFSGPGSVVFSGATISDVELANVTNLTTTANADVKLKATLANPETAVTGKVAVEAGTKFNAVDNTLKINELAGTGNYYMQHDGKLTVAQITEATNIQIQKDNVDYSAHENKVYVAATTVLAEPTITFNNDPNGLKLNKVGTDWVLEKNDDKPDTTELDKLVEEAFTSTDIEEKLKNATPELKKQFEDARTAAENASFDATTQEEVNEALEKLKKAIDAISAPATPPATTTTPTTVAPTTEAPTTQAPTTVAPTTEAPTTQSPTTVAPTTEAPTTVAPTTESPTTQSPTTVAPTTVAPTTVAPTTEAPTTVAPTTVAPTTVAPTTEAPTTVAPTTAAPTTVAPTTVAPTTVAPTTEAPTTEAPTTAAPTTEAPTTAAPTTEAPTTAAPTTEAPTTAAPTTEAPTTAAPTTEAPTTAAPTTEAPTTAPTTFPATVVDGPGIENVTAITTKIVTEAPVTKIVTEVPVTRIVTEAPVTRIETEAPVTRIVTDVPVTRIVTEAPVTRFVSNEESTAVITDVPLVTQIITEAPVTRIVTEAPATKVVTEAPVTKIETESPVTKVVTEAPVTQILSEVVTVTQKGETLVQDKPSIDVSSLVQSINVQKPELNLPVTTNTVISQQTVPTATKPVLETVKVADKTKSAPSPAISGKENKVVKSEGQKTLPKTSATTNETNSALPAGLAAILVAAGLMVARKENK